MNSEKAKEIKKALECCTNNKGCEPCPRLSKKPYHLDDCRFVLLADIPTLINELESENEQLKQSYVVKAYDKLRAENKALKKEIERIREEGNNIL